VDGSSAVSEIQIGALAAVVSRVPIEEFGEARAEGNTQKPDWVIPRACRHQGVVQEAMARSCVLPVRFGAVFSSEQRLAELVQAKHREIAGFLDSVEDKEEWAVKGTVDPSRAIAWLRARDPDCGSKSEIRNPKSEIASPGARYLADKKANLAVRERLMPWCRAMADQVAARLDAVAEAVASEDRRQTTDDSRRGVLLCPLPTVLCPLGSGQAERMFLHRAFLLPREGVAAFLEHVERLGRELAEQGIALTASGPWPPYSFAPSLWDAAEACGASSIDAPQESGRPQAAGQGDPAPQARAPQGAADKAGSQESFGTTLAQGVSNLL
jgi:hypothetical protein